MAKATKTFLEPLAPPPPRPYNLTLTLSQREAETLRELFQHIGGDPATTARKHTDAMDAALIEAGVTRYGKEYVECNGLYFVA